MARRTWTAEDRAELRRLCRCGFTHKEIAARYGVSKNAVACVIGRHGLVTAEEARVAVAEKTRGRKMSEETKRKIGAAQSASWTPERRERESARVRARRATPEGRDEAVRGQTAGINSRRRFAVPEEASAEYRFLRISKKLPAPEAGAILGLIPQPTAGGR